MSNQSVHDVLSAISTAKDALDAKPALESRIAELEAALANSERHAQSLELSIIDYKTEIDNKRQTIHNQEADIHAMALKAKEMEDRQKAVSRFLGSLVGDASTLNEVLNPPTPVVEPIPVSEPVPTSWPAPAEPTSLDGGTPAPSVGTSTVGQSADTSTSTATTTADAGSYISGRYFGKLYFFQPRWISRGAWHAEGGSEFGYNWRPDYSSAVDDRAQVPVGYSADIA